MAPPDLTGLSAATMAARLRAADVSSRELTSAAIAAARRDNAALNAWLAIDEEGALAARSGRSIRVTGTLKSDEVVALSTKAAGLVREVRVKEGDRVRRGRRVRRQPIHSVGATIVSPNSRQVNELGGLCAARRSRIR